MSCITGQNTGLVGFVFPVFYYMLTRLSAKRLRKSIYVFYKMLWGTLCIRRVASKYVVHVVVVVAASRHGRPGDNGSCLCSLGAVAEVAVAPTASVAAAGRSVLGHRRGAPATQCVARAPPPTVATQCVARAVLAQEAFGLPPQSPRMAKGAGRERPAPMVDMSTHR